MRKQLIFGTALVAALSATTVSAQEGLNLSVKGIGQTSWMLNADNSDASTFDYKTTIVPAFGLGVGYGLTDRMGVGLDVLYSMQGQRSEVSGAEFFQRNDYLKIPLMFTWNTDPSKGTMFLAKVGPQLGLLTGSKLENGDGETLVDDTKDSYMSTDFGAMLSLGASFRLTENLRLNTSLRGDYMFTNAEDEDAAGYTAGRAATNNATGGLEVGLTYFLN